MGDKKISFEKAMEKLEKIVAELESNEFSLENSIKKYEEGIKLTRLCQGELDKAKKKIETLSKNKSGKFTMEDFGDDEEEE